MAHDLSLRHLFVSASFGPFWCIVFIRIYCMIRKFATSGSSNFYIQQLFHFMFISLKKEISYIIQYHEFKLVTTHMRLWFKWFGLHVKTKGLKQKNVERHIQQRSVRYSSQNDKREGRYIHCPHEGDKTQTNENICYYCLF